MTPRLAVLGRGRLAASVVAVVDAINRAEGSARWEPVIGAAADLEGEPVHAYVVASERVDEAVGHAAWADEAGLEPAVLVHPTASVGPDVALAGGAVLAAGCRVTTNVRSGPHLFVGAGSTVSHDVRLGAHVRLGPCCSLTGASRVGAETVIGAGSVVLPGRCVGRRCHLHPGSVVVDDVLDGQAVEGSPARSGAASTSR